ncbi:translation elongation factor 4 [Sulfidibacter corallicola]|uniref:Elongation factor 4 n=1 Tax=Sulfidibacter corallicola TaxID=2818388 RepID=A0A8A4TTH7_SULCO|nr:translation elongation factor 4 [Sulfidibacter corallicola]QTD52830.1 elongation factor 4 [Sulfidibacter corallicola]
MSIDPKQIRNFSIIAHIDHGKSTLADRFLEMTGLVSDREKKAQMLDDMDLERERGITIKARSVTLDYKAQDGQIYQFNLIDTPGHVDFSYEVSRSLAACEGAILVVDAAQGVEAQTLANVYLAIENDLQLLPVLNKIDLPSAQPDVILEQIEHVIGLETDDACLISAKTGQGVDEVLEAVIRVIPPPEGKSESPLQALIFDAWFDSYRGLIILVRVFEGRMARKDKVRFMATGSEYDIDEVGIFTPKMAKVDSLEAGQVGYVIATIKTLDEARVGDTITHVKNSCESPLAGFKETKPMVFSGLYPTEAADYASLREALDKLQINDSSFVFEPETSVALGFGFRCGFLGLLHMEIIQERLEREFNLDLVTTAPGVAYRVTTKSGETMMIESPSKLPGAGDIEVFEEPYILGTILTNSEFVGGVLKLCEERRGIQKKLEYVSEDRILIEYELPLNEVVLDFYDKLKSVSRGYSSFDYHVEGYWASNLVKLDILVNGDLVDALSLIVHRDKAQSRATLLTAKMKELIPRQMFDIAIQAAMGARIVARTTVKALRKNVLAKCYGGDISRKRKLLEKQKAGKKRMKAVGNVQIPQDAFLAMLKVDN